jgi:hypothetical protein
MVGYLEPREVAQSAKHYLMDNVKVEYEKWFNDLYNVYESAMDTKKKGWHRIGMKHASE